MNSLNVGIPLVRMAEEHIKDAADLQAEKAKAKAAAKKASEARRGSDAGRVSTVEVSTIEEFKAQYTVDDALARHGYWVEGGRVFDPAGKDIGSAIGDDRVKIFDSNDPLHTESGEGRHDAWGVEVVLGYKNHEGRAIAAWSKKLKLADDRTVHETNVAAGFPALPDAPEGKQRNKPRLLVDAAKLETRKPDYLIDGIIERGHLGAIVAPPGIGKSAALLDMLLSLVLNQPWHGRAVNQGKEGEDVIGVIVNGEGHSGIKRRIDAGCKHRGVDALPEGRLYLTETALQLGGDGEAVAVLIEEIRAIGKPPALIAVDTLAANFIGDENSVADMQQFINNCSLLCSTFGSAVLIIHHTGLADPKRPRGSTAFLGALDVVYALTQKKGVLIMECIKMKDAPPPDPMAFRLEQVVLDDEGTTSIVLVDATGPQPFTDLSQHKLTKHQEEALRILREKTSDSDAGLTIAIWRESVLASWGVTDKNRSTLNTRFTRASKSLHEIGAVQTNGNRAYTFSMTGGE